MAQPNTDPGRRDVGRNNLLLGATLLVVILVIAFFIVETRRDEIGPAPEPPADAAAPAVR